MLTKVLRAAFGTSVLIVGPSLAGQPDNGNTWWTKYMSFIATNKTIPDQYTWHLESDPNNADDDPAQDALNFAGLLSTYKLPTRPININEYAIQSEQNPGSATWFISRLERLNWLGLRGNWASTGALHDFLANLLGKPGAADNYNAAATGYWPNGEWRLYQYYNRNMTGHRVKTTGSADNKFDVYATSTGASNGVKIIAGSRLTEGRWDITVSNMSSVGRPTSGNVNIRTYRFEFPGGTYGNAGLPIDLGVVSHAYTDNAITFWVQPDNNQTAYAFEFEG